MAIDTDKITPIIQAALDDDVLVASKKLMQRNQYVYEELAK